MADPKKPTEQPKNPDAEILVGGPGLEAPPEPTPKKDAPQLVTVKYGGKDYTVPPELAEAWGAREREFGQKLSEQGSELGQLRKFRESVQRTVTPETDKRPDLGTLLFENPNQALSEFENRVVERVSGMYRQDQNEQRFWGTFYRKHNDLDGEDRLCRSVMQDHWAELEGLSVPAAQEKIADLARSEILRISQKLNRGKDEELPQGRAVVEGASSPAPKRPAALAEEPPTLSQVIRERRAARLQPQSAKR